MKSCLMILIAVLVHHGVVGQQVPDTVFQPMVQKAMYSKNTGTVVVIDEAHHNFHTISDRFKPFSLLLNRDGYKVVPGTTRFSKKSLEGADILVVSNALHQRNVDDWSLPNPSAFADNEIDAVKRWVKEGGSLFLIADHMPFPGCNEDLATAFGFTFYNGFAIDTTKQGGPDLFSKSNARLAQNSITANIDSIYSFTGQAFDIPASAVALLTVDHCFKLWMPRVAWEFESETSKLSGEGKVQIAIMEFGKGRIVVSGEAAMFTAQLSGGGNRVGFNHPLARNNAAFLLRLIHWLDHR